MFTGLIEDVATIEKVEKNEQGMVVTVCSDKLSESLQKGDSIAIDGACSTVVNLNCQTFSVEYSLHTLSVTTLNNFKTGKKVNLERALQLNSRLNGHLVTGHVDNITQFISVKKDGFSYLYTFKVPQGYENQIIKKGSVALNGISLTVAECNSDFFTIAVIPHTMENTTLKYLKPGDMVNFETDLTGKYIEKILLSKDNNVSESKSNIDIQFLMEKGFI